MAHNITGADTTMLDSIPFISMMVFRMALIDDYPYEVGELDSTIKQCYIPF